MNKTMAIILFLLCGSVAYAGGNPGLRGLNSGGGLDFLVPQPTQRVEIDVKRKPSGIAAMSDEDWEAWLKRTYTDCTNQMKSDRLYREVYGWDAGAKRELERLEAGKDACNR